MRLRRVMQLARFLSLFFPVPSFHCGGDDDDVDDDDDDLTLTHLAPSDIRIQSTC